MKAGVCPSADHFVDADGAVVVQVQAVEGVPHPALLRQDKGLEFGVVHLAVPIPGAAAAWAPLVRASMRKRARARIVLREQLPEVVLRRGQAQLLERGLEVCRGDGAGAVPVQGPEQRPQLLLAHRLW